MLLVYSIEIMVSRRIGKVILLLGLNKLLALD